MAVGEWPKHRVHVQHRPRTHVPRGLVPHHLLHLEGLLRDAAPGPYAGHGDVHPQPHPLHPKGARPPIQPEGGLRVQPPARHCLRQAPRRDPRHVPAGAHGPGK